MLKSSAFVILFSPEPLPTLPLNYKGRAKIPERKGSPPFPLLFKGKGRDRVKMIIIYLFSKSVESTHPASFTVSSPFM